MAGAAGGAAVSAAPAGGAPAPVQTSAPSGESKVGDAKAPVGDVKTDAAKAPPKPAEPPKPQRFKAKAKFDGKEQDLDLEEAEVVREIQKARHYDKTRGDFEKRQATFEQTLQRLSEDPLSFLAERGVDLEALAAQKLQRQSELEKLTPADRALAEAQAEIERLRGAEAKRQKADQETAAQREHQELVQNTVRTLDAAIKLSGRKRSGGLVKLYSKVMELAEHAGEPPMSPEQIVAAGERYETQKFSDSIERAMADPAWRTKNTALLGKLKQLVFSQLQGKELYDFVGVDHAKQLARELRLALHKNPLPSVAESNGGTPSPAPAPAKKFDEPKSMFGFLDQLPGNR